jgi:antagonist of KipI
MDPWSHRVANAFVGNGPDAAALESTLLGPEIEFDAERVIAVVGAHFELTLDGRPVSMDAPLIAPAGSRLRFGRRLHGTRAYLAVAGGITVPPTLGSRSTHLASAMGGLDGRALKAGDRLPVGNLTSRQEVGRVLWTRQLAEGVARVRVLPGPHHERLGKGALDVLQSAPYVVGHNSDRMGFRLEGQTLASARAVDSPPDFISDAMPLGSIQVPASGQPIVLMADRQTTGGYPAIATVTTADIGLAGQLGPGDSVSFVVCSLREAMAALVERERAIRAIEAEGSA